MPNSFQSDGAETGTATLTFDPAACCAMGALDATETITFAEIAHVKGTTLSVGISVADITRIRKVGSTSTELAVAGRTFTVKTPYADVLNELLASIGKAGTSVSSTKEDGRFPTVTHSGGSFRVNDSAQAEVQALLDAL